MSNEQGDPVDLYIPRKWYVPFIEIHGNLEIAVVNNVILNWGAFVVKIFTLPVAYSHLRSLAHSLVGFKFVDKPID